jgi:hypoxanthine phosphoribosyltransferase
VVVMPDTPKTLLTREQIERRVAELGAQISKDYAGRSLVLLCVLKGGFVFTADLARAVDLPLRVEFLGVQSYGMDTRSSGVVQITQDLTSSVEGQDLLLVEDIVDSGLTSHFLMETLATRMPRSIKLCALLHKPVRQQQAVQIDYLGFTIEDVFVIGYGLDHAQQYRNLPYIGILPETSG